VLLTLACLGHWYVQILFAVPTVGVLGYMTRDSLVRKRNARRR
jgi:hypothetical protein